MPKIRHLAIRTEDTGKLASFYMDIFEMQVLHKDKREGGAVFLTDGYFNLAILPNHEQNSPNGLYHFGFEVENGEAIVEKMKNRHYEKLPKPRPDGRPYVASEAFRNVCFSFFPRWLRRSRLRSRSGKGRWASSVRDSAGSRD